MNESTYSLDGLLVKGDLDVEILQVVVRCGGLRSARLLMHGLAPRAIHLVVLLGVLGLGTSGTPGSHCHLLLLHHLHALHLHGLLLCILLLHPCLLLSVLLCLHLLPLLSRHLLLLLILLTTVLIVVLLLLTGVGLARGPRVIGSHRTIMVVS